MSRDSVQIALKIADLNDLDILACDIQSAYLTADCREQVWVVAGPDFGSEAGKNMLEDFKIKDDKIEPPCVYIGVTLAKMKLESGKYCWTISPENM